jgi:hypothetical protein
VARAPTARPGNKKESSVKKAILGMTEFAVLMIAAVALLGDSPVRTQQKFPCGDYGYDYGPKNVPLDYQLCIDTTAVPTFDSVNLSGKWYFTGGDEKVNETDDEGYKYYGAWVCMLGTAHTILRYDAPFMYCWAAVAEQRL